jgi:hypothetical protein
LQKHAYFNKNTFCVLSRVFSENVNGPTLCSGSFGFCGKRDGSRYRKRFGSLVGGRCER